MQLSMSFVIMHIMSFLDCDVSPFRLGDSMGTLAASYFHLPTDRRQSANLCIARGKWDYKSDFPNCQIISNKLSRDRRLSLARLSSGPDSLRYNSKRWPDKIPEVRMSPISKCTFQVDLFTSALKRVFDTCFKVATLSERLMLKGDGAFRRRRK